MQAPYRSTNPAAAHKAVPIATTLSGQRPLRLLFKLLVDSLARSLQPAV
ncbi:MAG: hypothetical protein F6K18_10990 [Okeania sp. SIO2C2]|nr:hypothetical protein [Okeania sp. SIO2C2]NEP87307.1 hypothetical protein [Okeania sp. SIO2C2]